MGLKQKIIEKEQEDIEDDELDEESEEEFEEQKVLPSRGRTQKIDKEPVLREEPEEEQKPAKSKEETSQITQTELLDAIRGHIFRASELLNHLG